MQRQLDALKAAEEQDMEAVLTDAQREALHKDAPPKDKENPAPPGGGQGES